MWARRSLCLRPSRFSPPYCALFYTATFSSFYRHIESARGGRNFPISAHRHSRAHVRTFLFIDRQRAPARRRGVGPSFFVFHVPRYCQRDPRSWGGGRRREMGEKKNTRRKWAEINSRREKHAHTRTHTYTEKKRGKKEQRTQSPAMRAQERVSNRQARNSRKAHRRSECCSGACQGNARRASNRRERQVSGTRRGKTKTATKEGGKSKHKTYSFSMER